MALSHKCVLNVDRISFESWLSQYHPDEDIIIIHDQLIAETVNTNEGKSDKNTQKVIGSPWLKKLPDGDNRFFITLSPDISKTSQSQPHSENCLLLTTKILDNKKTVIYFNFDAIALQPYIIDLLAKIQKKWPESARDAQKITQSVFKRDPNKLIDEFVIELDPEQFYEGLTSIILEDDPNEREFFRRIDHYRIKSKLCTYEKFPEDIPNQPWEYRLFAEIDILDSSSTDLETVVKINKSYTGEVTLRHLGRGRYHVKIMMEYEIPGLEKYLKDLAKSIRLSYPRRISKFTSRIKSSKRGPNEATKRKAEVIREIQESHPDWIKRKVAMEAGEELGMEIQIHDVDNIYRAMGWKWGDIGQSGKQ